MAVCPNCNSSVPVGATACGNCGASLMSPMVPSRLERALKRNRLLTYTALGLVVLLIVLLL
jgi:hypothetical protein